FVESRLVEFRFTADGLVARRPDMAAEHIAQKNVAAPRVAGGIFAPARSGDVAPAAVPRARRGEHQRIAAVRQQLRARGRLIGEIETARRVYRHGDSLPGL